MQIIGMEPAYSLLFQAKHMIETGAVHLLKKIFILVLAASVLQTLMPAMPAQIESSCCSVEIQPSSRDACCASSSPRRLLCCSDEADAPVTNVAQIPAPANKPLRPGLDLVPQDSFSNDNTFDGHSINAAQDFYACNVLLTSTQRYRLSAILII